MARLLMVRHGETSSNSSQRYWGQTDVTLSEKGIKQAERLKRRLASFKIDAAYASNLQRAAVTADIITAGREVKITTCPELGEINFGAVEGLYFSEISQRFPELAKAWEVKDPNMRYPGGDYLPDFTQRVSGFLPRLDKHTTEETVLIVSHSAVLRTLICLLMGVDMQVRWQFRLDLGSLSILDTYESGGILSLLNDSPQHEDSGNS